LRDDSEVRAVVLTGAGQDFCSGADLVENSGWSQADPASAADFVRRACEPAVRLAQLPQPTIAAVNGAAVGAGVGLAVACDLRVASSSARFVTPFVSFGIVPDFGLTWFLPRIVGYGRAFDILATCRTLDASEAERVGLVDRVADPPLAAALEIARTLAAMPVAAVRLTRRNLRTAFDVDLETEVFAHEADAQAVLMQSPEFLERFAEYRKNIMRG
jgi:enoyl-CoA hydratase/carnithine racemase